MTSLSQLTTLHLGGPAGQIVDCATEEDLVEVIRGTDAEGTPLLLLAGGSNLVVADEGFPGLVVRIVTEGVERREDGDRVLLTCQAGDSWDRFVERCVSEGLVGVECLSGIPGSIGATPIQNVGAYGQEVRETIAGVQVYDRLHRRIEILRPEECRFTYRSSVLKRHPGRWVVLAVTFALEEGRTSKPIRYAELARALGTDVGETAPLDTVRAAVLGLRRAKGMVLNPADPDCVSAGSFFLNPILTPCELDRLCRRVQNRFGAGVCPITFPQADRTAKVSAAWLIERAGFRRGYGDPNGIAISSKHTLALTNRGHGTTAQLLALAHQIANTVRRDFGVDLAPEPVLVGHVWRQSDAKNIEGVRPEQS